MFKGAQQLSESARRFKTDLSGLHFDRKSKHLLILSDESKLLTEADGDQTISYLELEKVWHGLKQSIPQAEGVTLDDDGNLYIISEPNLFYHFSPAK